MKELREQYYKRTGKTAVDTFIGDGSYCFEYATLEYAKDLEAKNKELSKENERLEGNGKIILTMEQLKNILHSATGNIKDFVTNENGFINEWIISQVENHLEH